MIFSKTIGKPLEKVLDIVGEILAFVVIALLAISFINAQFDFITNTTFLKLLAYTRTYAVIGVVAIVGLEFVIDKGLLITLIYLGLVALWLSSVSSPPSAVR